MVLWDVKNTDNENNIKSLGYFNTKEDAFRVAHYICMMRQVLRSSYADDILTIPVSGDTISIEEYNYDGGDLPGLLYTSYMDWYDSVIKKKEGE